MTAGIAGLNRIVEPMRAPIQDFANLLRDLGGDNVLALTVFGTLAARSFDATRHTARSVVVVDHVDLSMLRRLAEHGVKLGKAHISAPFVMTPQYIRDSLDTFPLELIEINQNHLTIFGDDYFEDLEFADADVRHQCERELKVMLIGMRQGLLAAAGRDRMLADVQQNMAENLLRTLRGMLWLKGRRDPQPASAVVAEVENLVSQKLASLRHSLDPGVEHTWELFEALYRDVAALGDLVDAW
jgi:hypothetical protein